MNEAAQRPQNHDRFISGHTELSASAMVPEIRLLLATQVTSLWQASEVFLEAHDIAPPFWAFAWPGSEALARYVTDHPYIVAGKIVLDFAAGCGLAGLACARAGAALVDAAEIDPLGQAAITRNAALNNLHINILGDIVGQSCRWDVIICGDVFYEAPMTRHILPWLRDCARSAEVLIADPARAYVPRDGVEQITRFTVPTLRELEDSASREVTIFRLLPGVSTQGSGA